MLEVSGLKSLLQKGFKVYRVQSQPVRLQNKQAPAEVRLNQLYTDQECTKEVPVGRVQTKGT